MFPNFGASLNGHTPDGGGNKPKYGKRRESAIRVIYNLYVKNNFHKVQLYLIIRAEYDSSCVPFCASVCMSVRPRF